tara:strand:- start:3318 stop:3806 length:489 start_codon:yes stop_codon:yes gene_type:complete
MPDVTPCAVPQGALLQRYVGLAGCYTDCFEVTLPGTVALPAFISAFYTTWLFRLERAVLTGLLRRRIRDSDVAALASGAANQFAAWTVEARQADQILLCDLAGHTRSFLAVERMADAGTKVLFGSAVAPSKSGDLGRGVKAMAPLHRFYSSSLLRAACHKLP